MSENLLPSSSSRCRPHFSGKRRLFSNALFVILLAAGLAFAVHSLVSDAGPLTGLPSLSLLLLALLLALSFGFVNGVHDTANAVTTVIYSRALTPAVALFGSGVCHFLGVMLSSGVVALSIISLLPAGLVPAPDGGHGFAMMYALLLSAIIWNAGTWYLGLPVSSSHTLTGAIIGAGVADALLHGHSGLSGVNWDQAQKVGLALLLSPAIGFVGAGGLLWLMTRLIRHRSLYRAPHNERPPPPWIRGLLILTCSGVSLAQGANDGQKGMGLIMLILAGTLPAACALNPSLPAAELPRLSALTEVTAYQLRQLQPAAAPSPVARDILTAFIESDRLNAGVLPALAETLEGIGQQVRHYGSLDSLPAQAAITLRDQMRLAAGSISHLQATRFALPSETRGNLSAVRVALDDATRFIPLWVKVVVATALGLGTLVGWRRIAMTVGERLGKSPLSYAQGASAELVAMITLGAAEGIGLPVSTTQVVSSGIAGTMVASRSGLRWSTLRRLAGTWLLTLPVTMLLSALLCGVFTCFSQAERAATVRVIAAAVCRAAA